MPAYHKLAYGTGFRNTKVRDWPYAVAISFDATPTPIDLSEGTGFCSSGCTISAAEALDPMWRKHFENANGSWLIPYVEQMAKGEHVSRHAILAEYKKRETEKTSPSSKPSLHQCVFYHLAHGELMPDKELDTPSDIYLCFDPISHPVDFSFGNGHHYKWVRVPPDVALTIKWRQHFENTDSLWLLPYIQRIAHGESVAVEEVSAKYQSIHGKAPEAY
jgi:hypothetical protein